VHRPVKATLGDVYKTANSGRRVTVDDPWGWGRSLEWATSCPPPRHNFNSLPRIRSESPAFDLHHPEVALLEIERRERARAKQAAGRETGRQRRG
jgi:cytochrome c oxidase subunit 1